MAEVQTAPSASSKDTGLLALAVLVALFGIGAFYWYDDRPLPLRIGMVVAGLALGAGLTWFSWYGREFWQFAQASRIELRKVVWPSRDETVKTTYVVFIFAIVMGLFFWGLDWVLTWMTRLLTGQSA
ncbi:MAG: preprotein translocase subunit SecE [Pseudomonadota bacterium]|nr:preprotein translocase subunit SecE [Pseudomonadota bacterium]